MGGKRLHGKVWRCNKSLQRRTFPCEVGLMQGFIGRSNTKKCILLLKQRLFNVYFFEWPDVIIHLTYTCINNVMVTFY